MKTSKKIGLVVAALLLAGTGIYLWYSSLEKTLPPYFAIPDHAAMVKTTHISPENLQNFKNQAFHETFMHSAFYAQADSKITDLVDKIYENEQFQEHLENNEVHISFHTVSMDAADFLFTLPSGPISHSHIENFVEENAPELSLRRRTFAEKTLYDVIDRQHKPVFSFAINNGILMFSLNTVLVEDGIRAINQNVSVPSVISDQFRQRPSESNFYIAYSEMTTLVNTLISQNKNIDKAQNPFNALSGNLRLEVTGNSLLLNGRTVLTDNDQGFINSIIGQNPVRQDLARQMPNRTAFFLAFGIEDYEAWFKEYNTTYTEDTANETETSVPQSHIWKFAELMGNAFAIGLYEPPSSDFHGHLYITARLKDEQAGETLLQMNNDYLEEQGQMPDSHYFQHVMLRPFHLKKEMQRFFSPFSPRFETPFFAVIGNQLYIAPNKNLLERIIRNINGGHILSRSGRYLAFEEEMLSDATINLYLNPSRLTMVPMHYLRGSLIPDYRKNLNNLKRIEHAGMQWAGAGDHFYTQAHILTTEEVRETTEQLWSRKLQDKVINGPFLVTNHTNNARELLFQDASNRLYLLAPSGEILWNNHLPGPIVGDVHQIDLYNNNRLQYLFTTAEYIHLVDRNGNDVANYPIRLSRPTQTGVASFDIRNDRNYRFYVGTEGNTIYGYQGDGRPLSGWNPARIRGDLTNPLKYFIFQGATYIIGSCDEGFIYLKDLRGNNIISPQIMDTQFNNPLFAHFGGDHSGTYVFSSDTNGIVHKLNLEGVRDTLMRSNQQSKHFFEYADFTGSGEKELVFTGSHNMEIYLPSGSRLRNFSLSGRPGFLPAFIDHEGETVFGYTEPVQQQAYVHDATGELLPGFPVPADRPVIWADLNRDGNKELITAKGNQVLIYRFR